jgi:hypothetical protein
VINGVREDVYGVLINSASNQEASPCNRGLHCWHNNAISLTMPRNRGSERYGLVMATMPTLHW